MAGCPYCYGEGIPVSQKDEIVCSKCGKALRWYHLVDWDRVLKIWEGKIKPYQDR